MVPYFVECSLQYFIHMILSSSLKKYYPYSGKTSPDINNLISMFPGRNFCMEIVADTVKVVESEESVGF